MKPTRCRTLIILPTLVCVMSVHAVRAQQERPQIAQNLLGNAPAVESVTPASIDTVKTPSIRIPRTESVDLNRVGVQTAQPISLTLAEAIRRALESNNDIEVTRTDVRFQETQVRALLGFYDPVFTASPTFSRSQTTGSEATNDFRVNTDLTQFIRKGGGNYQVFFNNNRIENSFAQAEASSGSVTGGGNAIYDSSLGVAYNQPLFRNRSIDTTRRQITIARRRLEQTDIDFRNRATSVITQVQQSYWELVFAMRNQQNQLANVNLAKENLRQVEARINAGASAPLERAEVATELAVREGDLLFATQQVSIAENQMKQLLLRDPLSAEWSQSFVPTDNPVVSPDPVSLDAALNDAMDNRFELRRLRIEREIIANDIKFFKNQTKPQIDLNTRFSLSGLASSGNNAEFTTNLLTSATDVFLLNSVNTTRASLGLPPIINPMITIPPQPSFLFGGFNRSLANIFRSDAPNFSIGVTISFPFRNRTAKANLEGARIQDERLSALSRGQEQTIIQDVRNAVQAVETTRQRVATARRARENAEIQLEGERKLYEAGRSTTFLLFQRENALTNARNSEIRAETDHNKALADLQRATSTAFQLNNIQIDTPVPNIRR